MTSQAMSLQKNTAAVRAFTGLAKFAAWLQAIPARLTPAPWRLLQTGSAFWQSCALHVAVRLDIASAIGDERLDADAIAARVAAHPDAVRRLLRMLAATGIFAEVAGGVYRNNALSGYLRKDNPKNIRAMILLHNSEEMSRPWYEFLEPCVRSGEVPFTQAHGLELFAYLDAHPAFETLFSRAMDSVDALVGDSYATDFDWGRFGRIIDIGGSKGGKSIAILKRHARLRALVVDRAPVIAAARRYCSEHEAPALLERLEFRAGDLLEAVPAADSATDIYLLSAVLHGFDDATCIGVLRRLAAACAGSGACIALLELVMPETGVDPLSAAFDMQMFIGTRGRERTLGEWRSLCDHSSLVLQETVGLRSFGRILVLTAG